MFKTVIFDIGNVIWDTYLLNTKTFNDWAKLASIDYDKFYSLYVSVYQKIETGHANLSNLGELINQSESELLRILDQNLGDDTEFKKYLINPNISLVKTIKNLGLSVGCLSNTENFMKTYLYRHIVPIFDYSTLSYEVACRKPDPEIYQLACSQAGSSPEDTIFIDDKAENIIGARNVGLTALLYTDTGSLISDLSSLLPAISPTPSAHTM